MFCCERNKVLTALLNIKIADLEILVHVFIIDESSIRYVKFSSILRVIDRGDISSNCPNITFLTKQTITKITRTLKTI